MSVSHPGEPAILWLLWGPRLFFLLPLGVEISQRLMRLATRDSGSVNTNYMQTVNVEPGAQSSDLGRLLSLGASRFLLSMCVSSLFPCSFLCLLVQGEPARPASTARVAGSSLQMLFGGAAFFLYLLPSDKDGLLGAGGTLCPVAASVRAAAVTACGPVVHRCSGCPRALTGGSALAQAPGVSWRG